MKLNIIRQEQDFEALKIFIDLHFKNEMRFIKLDMSIFEQWIIRPVQKIYIPKIWSYRIVYDKGQYVFGQLNN